MAPSAGRAAGCAVFGVGEQGEVATTGYLHDGRRAVNGAVADACGMTYGIGEGHEVVCRVGGAVLVEREPDDLPATRYGQALRVGAAQVVASRLGAEGQRPEHSRGVHVRERQGGDSRI
jgi:hypothetical protein